MSAHGKVRRVNYHPGDFIPGICGHVLGPVVDKEHGCTPERTQRLSRGDAEPMAKTTEDILATIGQEIVDDALENYRDSLKFMGEKLNSPLETVMFAALYYHFNTDEFVSFSKMDFTFGQPPTNPFSQTDIFLQAKVGVYVADFLFDIHFDGDPRRTLVVECDGHDFHERTKDQARKDRERDRWMLSKNITVMRFTGSEIWADPLDCAGQVVDQEFRIREEAHRAAN